jgi:hypothetical protein
MFWILLAAAVGLGLLITWVDSRPHWDDTGITAAAVLFITALLGVAMPERAWVWALAVGGWIPLRAVILTQNYAAFLALVIAFAGAYLGAFARKAISAILRPGPGSNPQP